MEKSFDFVIPSDESEPFHQLFDRPFRHAVRPFQKQETFPGTSAFGFFPWSCPCQVKISRFPPTLPWAAR